MEGINQEIAELQTESFQIRTHYEWANYRGGQFLAAAQTNAHLAQTAILNYVHRLREIRPVATKETSYYPALELLINSLGALLKPKVHAVVHPASIGAGLPDFGFYEKPSGALRGVVEAKSTTDDSLKTASGPQVVRYHGRYGLVLVTNYRDFVLTARGGNGRLKVQRK